MQALLLGGAAETRQLKGFDSDAVGNNATESVVAFLHNVFLHVSVPINQKKEVLDNKSIDLRLYEISEKKDISIKNIEHFIKLNAFDCKLNYKRNSQYKDDDSRDCEYTKCDYKCESNDIIDGIDDSTYKLYYNYDKKN